MEDVAEGKTDVLQGRYQATTSLGGCWGSSVAALFARLLTVAKCLTAITRRRLILKQRSCSVKVRESLLWIKARELDIMKQQEVASTNGTVVLNLYITQH